MNNQFDKNEIHEGQIGKREISFQEFQKHCKRSDCWVGIDDAVYDLTSFIEKHPGGDDILVENSGKDASILFHAVGHSEEAKAMMHEFCIGRLSAVNENPKLSSSVNEKPKVRFASNFSQLILLLAVIFFIIAVVCATFLF